MTRTSEVTLNFSIEGATLATLSDAYNSHLYPDRADAEGRLAFFRGRIERGAATADQIVMLRSERGVEAVVSLSSPPGVPMFPRARVDTPTEGLTRFYAHLLEIEPERGLVLDSNFVTPAAGPALAAGWTPDGGEHLLYETDLNAGTWALEESAQEGEAELLARPDIQALLARLGHADWEMDPEWLVVALPGPDGTPAALGAVGPTNRPGYGNINMMGVLPTCRGQGLGTRLHAHLLARAAERYLRHSGGTGADNAAMLRVFEKNGCQLTARQLYFQAG